jgi:hypothetical protein
MAKKSTTTTPVADIFGAAPTKAEEPKGKKKTEKPGVEMGTAIQKVAAIDFLMKALKGTRETYEGMAKDEMFDRFLEDGMKAEHRPENFRGVNGKGEASCEMRQRSSASPLSVEEVDALTEAGIEVTKVVTQEEAFQFNPEVLKNPELRAQISAAFAKINFGDIQPIVRIEPKEEYVASPEAIEKVFNSIKDSKLARKLTSMLTTLAIKSKWNGSKQEAYALLSEDETSK